MENETTLPIVLLNAIADGFISYQYAVVIAQHPDLVSQIEANAISCDTAILEINVRIQNKETPECPSL